MIVDLPYAWLALALLVACSAFFSASETALFSLTDVDRERAGAPVRRLMDDPQGLLVTVLLGNLVVNVMFFSLVKSIIPAGEAYGELTYAIAALLLILLAGEILPKTLALRAPIGVARASAVPMGVLVTILRPARRVVQGLLEIVLRALGRAGEEERGFTTEALADVLEQSAQHGLIESGEADLLAEVVELEGIRVREIMRPRVDVLALDLAGPRDEQRAVLSRALAERLTWLPVIRGNADDVVGSVRVKDLLAEAERPLRELVRRAQFVPEVASVLDLLRVLREAKATEAVVVDEYGGTAGIVTIEDIFEEIVGDLRVEGEEVERAVVALSDGRFRVSGGLSIRDWNEQFGREVVPAGFETVGGYVAALLGRIPRAGDRVRLGGLVSQVHEVRGRRVRSVDMYIEPPREGRAGGEDAAPANGAVPARERRADGGDGGDGVGEQGAGEEDTVRRSEVEE